MLRCRVRQQEIKVNLLDNAEFSAVNILCALAVSGMSGAYDQILYILH